MSHDAGTDANTATSNGTPVSSDPTVSAAEARVEEQREALAGTVDALQQRLDVKAQTQRRLAETKELVTTAEGKPRPDLLAGLAGLVLLLVGLSWLRRRRS